jgi:AraC-like DNA-binding protein
VCFQHSIGQANRRPSVILEAPVRFERPANEIVFAASTLDTVVVGADRTLLPMFEERANELTGAALVTPEIGASGDRLVAAVQEEVVRCLCDGPPQLARIARTLAMSSRTLQRELQRRGVRFKTLVNETRHRLSLVYLERPELSVTEIAFLLGYAELSAFDRAFRRAAGVSPRAWRSASR